MKRFSMRVTALLLAPVLMIGLLGLWISVHPRPIEPSNGAALGGGLPPGVPIRLGVPLPATLPPKLISPRAPDQVSLNLHLEKPTVLESFDGYDCAAEIAPKVGDHSARAIYTESQLAPYLELQAAGGVKRMTFQKELGQGVFGKELVQGFFGPSVYVSRFLLRLHLLPPGQVKFGLDTRAVYPSPNPNYYAYGYSPLHGKWPVTRANFAPRDLAALPRKPLIRLVGVKILRFEPMPMLPGRRVVGEIIFQIDSQPLSLQTPMEFQLRARDGNIQAPGTADSWMKPAKTPRLRISEWTLNPPASPNVPITLSGRITANKRWPLGFQTEPFRFNSVKVGQTLKFTQFPVPLPKG